MQPDGSILIDSRIDQTGFNKGVSQMGKTFGGLLKVISSIGKILALVRTVILCKIAKSV